MMNDSDSVSTCNVYEVYMLCMDKAEIVGEISIQFKLWPKKVTIIIILILMMHNQKVPMIMVLLMNQESEGKTMWESDAIDEIQLPQASS